jgi:hypothetical protein
MNLWDSIVKSLELTPYTSPRTLQGHVLGAYCGDLLSDVLAHSSPGDVWITIHRHRNIIAVASLVGIGGVIITGSREPDPETLIDAEREGIPLFSTPLNNFRAAGRLYAILAEAPLFKK